MAKLAEQIYGATARVREAFSAGDPPLTNHLCFTSGAGTIVFAFATDAALEAARGGLTREIEDAVIADLREHGCNASDARAVGVSFVSEEDVDRQGGPMSYFR